MQRCLGRVEASVADLTTQIHGLRGELSIIARNVETAVAGHRERLKHLESFRRSMIGIMTAVTLSGVAAGFAYILK
jgi:hypothetical protein